ncbi:hypothetical protein D3C81_1532020 [compost metagenome]
MLAVLLASAPKAPSPLVVTVVPVAVNAAPDSDCRPCDCWPCDCWPWVRMVDWVRSRFAVSSLYFRLVNAPLAWSPWVSTVMLFALRLTLPGLAAPIPA